MRFVSLFSGVGGFDLGLEQAGMSCVAQVEWDQHCQGVLQAHWPAVPKWGDVRDFHGSSVEAELLVFGSPCQDLSIAGKHAGLAGDRSGLFFEGIRIVKEMRDATRNRFPRWVVWENVAGALSSNKGADFVAVLEAFADIGALVIEWHVLDARWFGVPQRRRRVFVVACFDPATAANCPDPVLPVGKGVRRDSSTGQQKGTDFTTALTSSFGTGGPDAAHAAAGWLVPGVIQEEARLQAFGQYAVDGTASALKARDYKDATDLISYVPTTFAKRHRAADVNDAETWAESNVANTLNTFDLGDIRATDIVSYTPVYAFDSTFGGQSNVYDDHSPPVKVGSGAGIASPPAIQQPGAAVRRLTPLECERLMGWPDNHTLHHADGSIQSDTQRYKQCGNGVVAPVAAWVGKHIIRCDSHSPSTENIT